jgi:hypothetical protein
VRQRRAAYQPCRRGDGRYKPPLSALPHPSSKKQSMTVERTFSIIKPDATARNLTGRSTR